MGRPQHSAPFMTVRALSRSRSSLNRMKPKLFEEPVMGLVTTFAPSTDGNLFRKVCLSSASVTSGDRSPTNNENSGACSIRLPPAPQLSLYRRDVPSGGVQEKTSVKETVRQTAQGLASTGRHYQTAFETHDSANHERLFIGKPTMGKRDQIITSCSMYSHFRLTNWLAIQRVKHQLCYLMAPEVDEPVSSNHAPLPVTNEFHFNILTWKT